jgi:subtilase-type serine protease
MRILAQLLLHGQRRDSSLTRFDFQENIDWRDKIMEAKRRMVQRKSSPPRVFALTALSAAVVSALWSIGAAANEYSYANDPGFVAGNPGEVAAAKASWETPEYLRSGGLAVLNASSAYALGFFGQNRTVGVMDSGSYAPNIDFQGARWTFVTQEGVYSSSGMRYRGAGYYGTSGASAGLVTGDGSPYTAGDAFSITGAYVPGINDGHGTSVTGIVGANRDGAVIPLRNNSGDVTVANGNMHGIAFGTDMVIGNTGATDNNNYGPFLDYNFFYTGFKAMIDAGAEVINNSWGTNIRINMRKESAYFTTDASVKGPDGGNVGIMIPTNNVADVEYEYFYWKKVYGEGNPSFVDGAYDAVKGTDVVYIMTTGNRDMANPFHRALYPYFHPEAEKHWIAAAGIMKHANDPGHLVLVNAQDSNGVSTGTGNAYNEAGLAKWWTMTGYTLTDAYTTAIPSGTAQNMFGTGSFSGTSGAAPHLAGSMGVLMSRYLNMNASQVRDVMFTTGTNRNTDGTLFDGWTSPDGVPDERYGWGLPDLEKGMYGPGQLLGRLEYDASVAPLDVWSNDISQVGLNAREVEDLAWLNYYKANGISGLGTFNDSLVYAGRTDAQKALLEPTADYVLGDQFEVADNDTDPTNHIVSQADAEKWRKEYADARAAAIQEKIDNGLYDGSLVKQGPGTLILTGNNSYEGGTTVQEGSLYGFTESFGNGTVSVDGGRFGILSSYNDTFTMKGLLNSTFSHKVNVEVNDGGTFVVVAGQDAQVGALSFKDGSKVTVGAADRDLAQEVWDKDTTATGTVTADSLVDFEKAVISPDYAFLNVDIARAGNVLTGSLTRNGEASYAEYGEHRNGREIGALLDRTGGLYYAYVGADGPQVGNALPIPTVTKEQVRATLDTLGSDLYLNADNAAVVNQVSIARSVRNQALGIGGGRSVKLNDSARLWATVSGHWGDIDFGHADADSKSQTGLVGAEVKVTPDNTVGVFFGAGESELDAGRRYGKVDSDDLHVGVYGVYKGEAASVNYGVIHSRQDRDARRTLIVGDFAQYNKVTPNATVTQFFGEAAYTGAKTAGYTVEPYAGLAVLRVKSDGFSENVGDLTFRTKTNSQTLTAGTLGVRGSIPVGANVSLTGDLSAIHFFGNNTPEAKVILGDTGTAKIEGGKLGTLLGVGIGLEANVTKATKLNVSYTGAFNGDVKSHGISANLRISF